MPMHFAFYSIVSTPETSRSAPMNGLVSNARLPSDPLFLAPLVLQNLVVGSRYWIARADDLSQVLATGIAASSTFEITNVPAFANPMLVEIRVRKASNLPKYKPFVTFAYLVRTGVSAYIAQELDTIAG